MNIINLFLFFFLSFLYLAIFMTEKIFFTKIKRF